MATSAEPRPRRQLFLVLSGIAFLTLMAIGLLTFPIHHTLVELELEVTRAKLLLVPGADVGAGEATGEGLDLLAETALLPRRVSLRRVDGINAYFAGHGAARLRPREGGSIRLESKLGNQLPPQPKLRIFRPTRLEIVVSPRQESTLVRLSLEKTGPGGWLGSVPDTDLHLALRDVDVELADGSTLSVAEEHLALVEGGGDLVLSGGGQEAEISFELAGASKPSTRLRVVDLGSGAELLGHNLDFALDGVHLAATAQRLVLLEPRPGGESSRDLLRRNLQVRDLELFETNSGKSESHILGGRILFPSRERQEVELENGDFLALTTTSPLTLRSCRVVGNRLQLRLLGEASRLELGVVPSQRAELLPNYFQWLYAHELRKLLYGILAAVLGTSLVILRLFGLFKD